MVYPRLGKRKRIVPRTILRRNRRRRYRRKFLRGSRKKDSCVHTVIDVLRQTFLLLIPFFSSSRIPTLGCFSHILRVLSSFSLFRRDIYPARDSAPFVERTHPRKKYQKIGTAHFTRRSSYIHRWSRMHSRTKEYPVRDSRPTPIGHS